MVLWNVKGKKQSRKRAKNGEGPRGRNPPLDFKLKDLTLLKRFFSVCEKNDEYKCDICGITFLGKEDCEKHLRDAHFKEYKSLFAKQCFAQIENHVKYKQWESEEAFIDGMTLSSQEAEKQTVNRNQKKG